MSGQHVGEHALPPPPRHGNEPLPAPIEPRTTVRLLHGAGSFDPGDADPDPYGDADAAVAARPEGWRAPADGGVPRVAVVVVGGERDASALDALLAEPVPLTVVVSPSDAHDALRAVREAGKTALVACQSVDLATLVSLRRAGAAGIACSTGDASRARALVVADRGGMVFDDRDHDDALYRAARAAHVPAVSRDVVVDAREERAYVDFLFDQALAIARRTGAATAVVHARPSSIPALQRFERHAQRAGVDLVDLRSLAP